MKTRFFSKHDYSEVINMQELLLNGFWKSFSIDNYFATKGHIQPHHTLPHYKGLVSVSPGAKLDSLSGEISEDRYFPKIVDTSYDNFLQVAYEYFSQFKGKKIGVHLSGGLDSSIIICLLKFFDIPCYLVGFSISTFEFRTERYIQEIMASYGYSSKLFDLQEFPPYSNLKCTPLANIPDETNTKNNDLSNCVIREFVNLGVEVVFTGQGGDTIFADELTSNYSCNFGYEFYQGNEDDYQSNGISLVSLYRDPVIVDHLFSARLKDNGRSDSLKYWARNYFKDILPKELSMYTYVADFFGTSLEGLVSNSLEIREIFETAYSFSKIKVFSPRNVNKFLSKDVFSFGFEEYIAYNKLLSLGCWYYSLNRDAAKK